MARNENPPFPLGATLYDGGTIDTNDLAGLNLEGKEWVFEDIDPETGLARTNRSKICRCVRNTSGINLLPKRLVRFEADGAEWGGRVDGYAATTAEECYPVDEYLPTAGVPNNDVFWIVIEGPAVVITSLSDMGADVAVGDWMVAITAATSGATTAGRATSRDLTGSSAATDYEFLANQIENRIGRALTARTTANTNNDILLDVGRW